MSLYSEFPDGVRSFTSAVLNHIVNFPEKRVCCKFCPFCIYDRNTTSSRCIITHQMLYRIDKGVGIDCPLEIITEEGEIK